MDFRILGSLEVRTAAGIARKLNRRKPRLLLAILLLNANQRLAAGQLIDWLWGERPPASAQQNLHTYVSELRRALEDGDHSGEPRIRMRSGHYELRVEPGELDAETFEELVSRGVRAVEEKQPAVAVERFARALGLWRSDAVADGLDLPDSVRGEVARLEQLRALAMEAAFEARIELGRHLEVLPELERATRAHPLRERLWALRMLALHRSGLRAEALAGYQQLRDLLGAELGVAPGSDIRHLHDQILAADPALDAAPRTVQPVPAAQLPGDTMVFTGRRTELARLSRLAEEQRTQPTAITVVTIDGMAGVGKTALALHAAHRLAPNFPDGQLFLDLHGFSSARAPADPSEALEQLLRSVGVPSKEIPPGRDARAALWRTHVAGLQLLIVLDNAAGEEQVTPLIPGSAGCLVLVTSRLRLAGLDTSTSISLDVLPESDAAELLTRAVGADRIGEEPAELVAEVAALCGQLPLALRIAAARLANRPAWQLEHVAQRLRDERRRVSELQAGERSVAAALHLSYRQLTAEQQRMFRLLGLYPGPDIEPFAAAALAATTVRRAEQLLDDLLDANLLLQHQVGRYQFHDLVRALAAQAGAGQTPATQRRSATNRLLTSYAYTTTVAAGLLYPNEAHGRLRPDPPETPAPDLREPKSAAAWLDTELDNLLAAAKAPVADDDSAAKALRIATQLHWHLRTRARHSDAEQVHAHALETARRVGDRKAEQDALTGLGHAYHGRGHHATATECFEQALLIARETGDRIGELTVGALGHVQLVRGRLPEARRCFEQALETARDLGDRIAEVGILTGLASVHRKEGHADAALACFERAHAIASGLGDRTAELGALIGLGRVHQQQLRYQQAEACFSDVLSVAREVGHLDGQLNALLGLGDLQLCLEGYEQAEAYFERLLGPATEIGDRNYQFEALQGLGRVCLATGREEAALARFEPALRLARELDQAGDQARAHDGLARAYDGLGRSAEAGEHWQAALEVLAGAGPAEPTGPTGLDVAEIQARLNAAFERLHEAAPQAVLDGLDRSAQ